MNEAKRLSVLSMVESEIEKKGFVMEENPFGCFEESHKIEYSRSGMENRLSYLRENCVTELRIGMTANSFKRRMINKIRQIAVKIMNPIVSQQNGINTNSYELMEQMYAYIVTLEERIDELEGKKG